MAPTAPDAKTVPDRSPAAYAFDLSGGAVCLDFVNTLGNRAGPEPREEHLASYADLVEFGRQAGTLPAAAAEALAKAARARPEEADRVLARAIDLREALQRIFGPLARDERPDERDLAGLNAELGPALSNARVSKRADGYALAWDDPVGAGPRLDAPLWPVAHSAMDLLLEADLSRIGECESDTCGFLYLDTTKNRSRRWCDTRICGNRARVRRHRRRVADAG
jgi:predicted RNA-binding Zn ribbon-like protein